MKKYKLLDLERPWLEKESLDKKIKRDPVDFAEHLFGNKIRELLKILTSSGEDWDYIHVKITVEKYEE